MQMHKYKIRTEFVSTVSEDRNLKLILKMAKFKAKLRSLADNPQIVCEHDFIDERKL